MNSIGSLWQFLQGTPFGQSILAALQQHLTASGPAGQRFASMYLPPGGFNQGGQQNSQLARFAMPWSYGGPAAPNPTGNSTLAAQSQALAAAPPPASTQAPSGDQRWRDPFFGAGLSMPGQAYYLNQPFGSGQPTPFPGGMTPGGLDPSMGSMPLGPTMQPTVQGRSLANWNAAQAASTSVPPYATPFILGQPFGPGNGLPASAASSGTPAAAPSASPSLGAYGGLNAPPTPDYGWNGAGSGGGTSY